MFYFFKLAEKNHGDINFNYIRISGWRWNPVFTLLRFSYLANSNMICIFSVKDCNIVHESKAPCEYKSFYFIPQK